jgi:hypothetical protein
MIPFFEALDIEADRRTLEDYYFKEILPDDYLGRDEYEDIHRENLFNKLTDLARVLTAIKKRKR